MVETVQTEAMEAMEIVPHVDDLPRRVPVRDNQRHRYQHGQQNIVGPMANVRIIALHAITKHQGTKTMRLWMQNRMEALMDALDRLGRY